MTTHESFTCILLHTVFYGLDCYVGLYQEEDEGGAGGDATHTFTEPFFELDEARNALARAFKKHRARRKIPPTQFDRSSIRVHVGVLLKLEGGERVVACFGRYVVVVFNEGTPEEFCVVFGPGNAIVSDRALSREAALELARAMMLVDDPEVQLGQRF